MSEPSDSSEPSEDENTDEGFIRPRATGFVTIVARAWRTYYDAIGPLAGLFAVLGLFVLAAQTPLMFTLSDETLTNISYLVLVLVPAVVYGYGIAIATYVFEQDARDDPVRARTAAREVREGSRSVPNVAMIGSVLTGVNIIVLGPLLPFMFYGPPILMQVVVVEQLRMSDGWARAKQLLNGNWGRVILYLISFVLTVGLVSTVGLGLVSVLTEGMAKNIRRTYFVVVQAGLLSFVLPYLAAAHYELYRDLAAPE